MWDWPIKFLAILLIAQIGFNYYSSYMRMPKVDGYFLNLLIEYRQSYLVLHYLFIFLFGALWSARLEYFNQIIFTHTQVVKGFFYATLIGMLGAYYFCLGTWSYRPDEAVNTVHQLNPIGVLYTLAAVMFFYVTLSQDIQESKGKKILGILGHYSFMIYLIHPTMMYFVERFLIIDRWVMDIPVAILFYSLVVLGSLFFAWIAEKIVRKAPLLSNFIGVKVNTR